MSARRAPLALLAAVALVGCRAAGPGRLPIPTPAPVAAKAPPTVAEVVAGINAQAGRIESFQARSNITAYMDGRHLPVNGNLAMRRPRDFRMMLYGGSTTMMKRDIVDIGSNPEQFWFSDSENKTLYFGRYDANGAVPSGIPVALQPDWIVESLGLRPIPPEEVATMELVPGPQSIPDSVWLVDRSHATGEGGYVKKMLVDVPTKRIRQSILLTPDEKTPLASAVISEYRPYPLPARTAASGTTPAAAALVPFPTRVHLKWNQEKLEMDVGLSSVQLNTEIPDDSELFVVPIEDKKAGRYAIRELSGDPETYARASAAPTHRETMPAPPAGGVQLDLETPASFEDDGAAFEEREASPSADADLPPLPRGGAVEPFIGEPAPRPPGEPPVDPAYTAQSAAFAMPDR